MLRYIICLLFVQTTLWAQDADIFGEIENSNTVETLPKKNQKPTTTQAPITSTDLTIGANPTNSSTKPAPGVPATGNLKMEDYFQTWNARKLRQGIGYSPLLNLAQYDRWITAKWGVFVGFRYQKSTDTATETKTTSYNQTTLALTDSTQFGGTRNPTTIALMVGAKNRIWQNDFLQINWGPLLLYTHGTSVSYSVGSITKTVTNVNSPNDFTMTETGLGSTSNGVDPTYSLGVKVGSEFYLKWFPNLSLCADVVFLNQLPLKGTQESNTATKTYNVVAGVAQSPTAESYNTSRTYNDYGGAASTSQVGAQYFNILGANWSIKYVW